MAFLLLLCALVASDAEPIDVFLADMAQSRSNIQAIDARFVQENHTPDEVVIVSGTIRYRRPNQMLYKYEESGDAYLIDGRRAFEYRPHLKQVEVYELEGRPETEALFLGFTEDTSRLKEAYNVELFSPLDDAKDSTGLVLHPKNREEGQVYFEEVKLYLHGKNRLPFKIEIVNDADSQTEIRISDISIANETNSSPFQIDVPEGVKIIVNGQFYETVGPEGKKLPFAPAEPKTEDAPAVSVEELPAP